MDYYIVVVGEDGDVLACNAHVVERKGLDMIVRSDGSGNCSFDNQGDDNESKVNAATECLAARMPEIDEEV